MDKKYVLVVNNIITSTPAAIPQNYKNISNFYALSDAELSDLSWSGNEGGFWLVESNAIPVINIDQKIEVNYSLDVENKKCYETFSIAQVTPEEKEVRINRIKTSIRMTRDQYLLLTDFTQLSDAPISDTAKEDFKTFRQQLRSMLDIPDVTQAVWPTIPTSAANISLPPFPPIPTFNG